MLSLPNNLLPADHIIAWRDGQPIRNAEFQTRVHAWRTLLENTPGQKFALYLNDSLEFASALFGGWLAGKTLYLPNDVLHATCSALQKEVDGFLGEFAAEWSPLVPVTDYPVIAKNNSLAPDFVGIIIYTSGSTGAAQAIPKRLHQLATEITTLENLFGSMIGSAKTEILATVSHAHIYGLLFKILWPLTTGCAFHVRSVVFPEELAPTLNTRDCVLITSPAHLNRFTDSPAFAMLANHARAVFCSGGPLPLEVAHATERLLGKPPIEIYGSSETGGIAWRQCDIKSGDNASWRIMPNIAWRIADDDGTLEIQSPHLPNNAWFRTADRVVAYGDGFLLQGRTDRIVKLEGKRISLDAIERCLVTSPLISSVRVIMLDEKNQRQRIAAFVVLNADGHAKLTGIGKLAFNHLLRDTLIDSVERIALPRSWRYLTALPVNAQGKTTRADLMALLNTESTSQPIFPHQLLLKKNDQTAILELTIPQNLFYFDGHFPNAPILPGVVQIDWAIHYGRQCFDLPLYFRGLQVLKFQRVIQPGMTITLELEYIVVKSTLSFRYYSQAGQHASGRVLLGNTDD